MAFINDPLQPCTQYLPTPVGLNYTHNKVASGACLPVYRGSDSSPRCERNIYRRDTGGQSHVYPMWLREGWLL